MVSGQHLWQQGMGTANLSWRENVKSRANFSVGVIHQQLDTLGLNLCELANYYTIIIHKQTNKHI